MKNLISFLILLASTTTFSQNIIEVSISKIGVFAKYGKDSLHLMIAKSECGHYSRSYDQVNLKLVINKSQKKIFRFNDNVVFDTLPIKKIAFKDSIYTITVSELCSPMYSEFEGQKIDCYLVLDTRKNQIHKNLPTFCYYWNRKFVLNDETVDSTSGRVTDFVQIYQGDSVRKPKKEQYESSSITNTKVFENQSSSIVMGD
jgi:hypothetical protein